MEMYADVESRGGILEPPGICEVKFRAADQVSKMHEVSRVFFYRQCGIRHGASEGDGRVWSDRIGPG